MNIDYYTINAFVENGQGGNPAGVVLDADRLNRDQKQAIARAAGLSETAFVSQSSVANFKLEFFTPTRQIAHCGHATIAAFSLLKELGRVENGLSSKETIDGTRTILIEDDKIFMEQRSPIYRELGLNEQDKMLAAVGLTGRDIAWNAKPTIVDTGNAFLIIPFNGYRELGNVKPDLPAIKAISEEYGLIGFYIFSQETQAMQSDASARMFAPAYGIDEEAATGMAAGPLACFLHDRVGRQLRRNFNIEQGYFMQEPSPSLIHVRLETEGQTVQGKVQRLFVGGKAKVIKMQNVTVAPKSDVSFPGLRI